MIDIYFDINHSEVKHNAMKDIYMHYVFNNIYDIHILNTRAYIRTFNPRITGPSEPGLQNTWPSEQGTIGIVDL